MKKLIFCILFIVALFSCEKPDDGVSAPVDLNGKWELQNASCFCFFPDDFDFSAHKVDFNIEAWTLIVENSTETFFISEAGSYNFKVQGNKIVIADKWEFTLKIEGDMLILSYVDNPEIADDEVTLTYEKVD